MKEAEINKVMAKNYSCCLKNCISKWKHHFDGDVCDEEEGISSETSAGKTEEKKERVSKARAIITVNRAAFAGMDPVQRMLHYEARLRVGRELVTGAPVSGGPSVQTDVKTSRCYIVETQEVLLCQQAYCDITALSLRTLQRYVARIREEGHGTGRATRGRPLFSDCPKTQGARAWFKHYVSLHDVMPHKSKGGCTEASMDLQV